MTEELTKKVVKKGTMSFMCVGKIHHLLMYSA